MPLETRNLNRLFAETRSTKSSLNALLVFIFFGTVLIIGLLVTKDYGISWDEDLCRTRAAVTIRYILIAFFQNDIPYSANLKSLPDLHQYQNRDYGVAFELPALLAEKFLKFDFYSREAYLFRHTLIFLSFCLGVYFFYLIVKQRFNSTIWGLFGSLILIVSPRIFAHSFYNSKDIVFMATFCIGMYTLIEFLKNPTPKLSILHALACAIAIDIRVLGVVLPVFTISFLLIQNFVTNHKKVRNYLTPILLYTLVLFILVVGFWPLLWENPLRNFVAAFGSMANFRFNEPVFYLGKMTPASELPWHYLLVWISISTPVLYTVCFLAGAAFILYTTFTKTIKIFDSENDKQDLIYLLIFIAPLLAIWVFHSVVYDAWRQVFFIYPAFLLVSLSGINKILNNNFFAGYKLQKIVRYTLSIALTLNIIQTLIFMVKNHPHQNVYFSLISGDVASNNFERDYWGLSYKQGLEFLADYDKSDTVTYYCAQNPGLLNKWMLPAKDQNRLMHVPFSKAKYFLTDYRWHPKPYPYPNEIFKIEIEELKIMSVYKLK